MALLRLVCVRASHVLLRDRSTYYIEGAIVFDTPVLFGDRAPAVFFAGFAPSAADSLHCPWVHSTQLVHNHAEDFDRRYFCQDDGWAKRKRVSYILRTCVAHVMECSR